MENYRTIGTMILSLTSSSYNFTEAVKIFIQLWKEETKQNDWQRLFTTIVWLADLIVSQPFDWNLGLLCFLFLIPPKQEVINSVQIFGSSPFNYGGQHFLDFSVLLPTSSRMHLRRLTDCLFDILSNLLTCFSHSKLKHNFELFALSCYDP